MKYNIIHVGTTTIATTRYKGRLIKAKAKCHPDDQYNQAYGDFLAMDRCRLKFLKAKMADLDADLDRYVDLMVDFQRVYEKKLNARVSAYREYCDLKDNLGRLK